MYYERVIRVASAFFQLIGYQVHVYDRKTRRFRVSLWNVFNFISITILYVICFGHHCEGSVFLKLLDDISPFLRQLVHIQLIVGLKVFLFHLYEMRHVVRSANCLIEALPSIYAHRFSRNEAVAYALLFSTLFISLCIVLYVAYEMHFTLPPIDRILVALALFIPHFIVAGALRFYTIGLWLLREHLQNLSNDIDAHLTVVMDNNVACVEATNSVLFNVPEADRASQLKDLLKMHTQLDVLASKMQIFSKGLRRQVLLLFAMNTNSLLAGVYMRVYYDSTWYVILDGRLRRIFLACNYGLFMVIFWDYLCLCGTQAAFTRVKTNFYKKINAAIKQQNDLPKSTLAVLKNIRDILHTEFRFKIIASIKLSTSVFLLVQILIALAIAIVVVYQFLKDKVRDLSDRLDDIEAANE